jgi:putative redox protein
MATVKTVKVTAVGPENWLITTKAGIHTALVDQPESLGGNNQGPSPLDYVFISLAGCLITIGKIVASQRHIDLRGMEVEISGDLNLDVLRGKEKNERAGFQNITAIVKIDADMSEAEKNEFLEEVDRRCPISDNLMNTTPIQVKLA